MAHQLLLQQWPDYDIQKREFDENLEVLLSAAKFLEDGGEPLQVVKKN